MARGLTHLHEYGLEATVIFVNCGTAFWLAGQVDACGTVQLLQMVETTLFLKNPVGRAGAVPGLFGGTNLRIEAQGER